MDSLIPWPSFSGLFYEENLISYVWAEAVQFP